jgi:hypothetical protein
MTSLLGHVAFKANFTSCSTATSWLHTGICFHPQFSQRRHNFNLRGISSRVKGRDGWPKTVISGSFQLRFMRRFFVLMQSVLTAGALPLSIRIVLFQRVLPAEASAKKTEPGDETKLIGDDLTRHTSVDKGRRTFSYTTDICESYCLRVISPSRTHNRRDRSRLCYVTELYVPRIGFLKERGWT